MPRRAEESRFPHHVRAFSASAPNPDHPTAQVMGTSASSGGEDTPLNAEEVFARKEAERRRMQVQLKARKKKEAKLEEQNALVTIAKDEAEEELRTAMTQAQKNEEKQVRAGRRVRRACATCEKPKKRLRSTVRSSHRLDHERFSCLVRFRR